MAVNNKKAKASVNDSETCTERKQSRVVLRDSGTLELNMQNPDVIRQLYQGLDPDREKRIIHLQRKINSLRSNKADVVKDSSDYALSAYKINY